MSKSEIKLLHLTAEQMEQLRKTFQQRRNVTEASAQTREVRAEREVRKPPPYPFKS